MHLGKVAPEPTYSSPEIAIYRNAFKASVTWLGAFATSYEVHLMQNYLLIKWEIIQVNFGY